MLLIVPVLVCWPVGLGFSVDPLGLVGGLAVGGRPGVFPGTFTLDLNVGVTTQALGRLAAEQWLSGRVPWWNPYTGIGMPLAGEMQASALFLPFVLLLHFADGPLLLKWSMQVVAGVSCFGLLRAVGVSRGAALLGGVLFELSLIFGWLGHAPIMPVAFLPLFLWGIERARGGSYRLIAVAVALSLYAGFPETAYLDGVLALVWAVWRCVGAADRWRFAGRVGLGGLLGLGLAAPALWSFGHFLWVGTSVNHAVTGSMFDPVPEVPSMLPATWVFPYIFGPLFGFADAAGVAGALTQFEGGAVGAGVLVLACVGLFGARLRGLRFVLAGWVVLVVGGVMGAPLLGHVLYAVPLLRQAIVARYAMPSLNLAAIVMAVLAVEDWRRGAISRRALVAGGGLAFVLAVACLVPAVGLARSIAAGNAGYWVWPVVSVGWGAAMMAVPMALMAGAARRRVVALGLVLAVDAAAMFAVPMLSGQRDVRIDWPAVAFLRDHVGLQRFYALGVYRPNYGAFFATPQLNYEYLPLPENWVAHVRDALDPSASPIMFRGDEPPLPPGVPDHAAQLVRNLPAYAALGVKYVAAPAGQNPFVRETVIGTGEQPEVLALFAGQATEGAIASGVAGEIDGLGLVVGTYGGASDGALVAELCVGAACATGRMPLRDAPDNGVAMIALDRPLAVPEGAVLRWRITHEGGSQAVALWHAPRAAPHLHLRHATVGPIPARVYGDGLMDIYEITEAAPYFDSRGGPCRLAAIDADAVAADCAAPAILIRRALFFPGWRARIDGREAPIAAYQAVMQAVAVPAGMDTVRFDYAPPGVAWAWALMALGCAGLLPWRAWRQFAGLS